MINKLLIIFFLFFFNSLKAEFKEQIILNLKNTKNLAFDFKQQIKDEVESGKCIIEYPKKIWCEYNFLNNKIMISNGKSLVIKNDNVNQYYLYPLSSTPLELILDKNYMIKKIKKLESRNIDDKYVNFTINDDNFKINFFFDKKTLYLTGWQTEDIYQNLVVTFITNVKINQKISNSLFQLPKKN